jgi:hypothetical protein
MKKGGNYHRKLCFRFALGLPNISDQIIPSTAFFLESSILGFLLFVLAERVGAFSTLLRALL